MLPLGLLATGEKATVVKIILKEHNHHHQAKDKGKDVRHSRIEDLGLRAGKMLEVLNNKGPGPILIKVDDSRIAIARGVAMKIMVRKENQ